MASDKAGSSHPNGFLLKPWNLNQNNDLNQNEPAPDCFRPFFTCLFFPLQEFGIASVEPFEQSTIRKKFFILDASLLTLAGSDYGGGGQAQHQGVDNLSVFLCGFDIDENVTTVLCVRGRASHQRLKAILLADLDYMVSYGQNVQLNG